MADPTVPVDPDVQGVIAAWIEDRSLGACADNMDDLAARLSALLAARVAAREAAGAQERFARIGQLFCELWEMGAPWPVERWTCNAHAVVGCIPCRRGEPPPSKGGRGR